MTLEVSSQALPLGLALGGLLSPARGHSFGPLRGLPAAELSHMLRTLEPP